MLKFWIKVFAFVCFSALGAAACMLLDAACPEVSVAVIYIAALFHKAFNTGFVKMLAFIVLEVILALLIVFGFEMGSAYLFSKYRF